ncbi:MAG: RsmE family RNA methyltransferase [Hydrogenophaga sp.]|nr:RsmE family RNA methyltransferase [Hydrogenophaga sp.]
MSGGHSKHEFALYVPMLTAALAGVRHSSSFFIDDALLVHRIQSILRLEPGDEIRLFDRRVQALCVVQAVNKKKVIFTVGEKKENSCVLPVITFCLPLLKKEDLEAALYSLVELGATAVKLVITDKSRQLGSQERESKEFERLERIMIAAAEQSKQFAFPLLSEPISFQTLCKLFASHEPSVARIFFDPAGDDLFTVMTDLRTNRPAEILLFVGPEGDLTEEEKGALIKAGVRFCKLTPTVLRAMQATAVGMGVVRSVIIGS